MQRFLTLCFGILLTLQLQAQGWEYSYGLGLTLHETKDIEITNDGGCLVVGRAIDIGPVSPSRVLLIKLDQDGEQQWIKEFSEPPIGFFAAESLDQSVSGEFGVVGTAGIFALVAKLDQQGDTLWTKLMGDPLSNSSNAQDIKFSDSGDLLVVWRESGEGQKLTKLDPNGNLIWEKVYTDSSGITLTSLDFDNNGNIVAAGNQFDDLFFIKFDTNGNELWQSTIETGFGGAIAYDVVHTSNGDFAFGGQVTTFSGNEPVFGTVNSNGVISLPAPDLVPIDFPLGRIWGLTALSDGGFGLTLQLQAPSGGVPVGIIVKLNSNFTPEWRFQMQSSDNPFCYSIEESLDGGLIATGVANEKAYTIKLGGDGRLYDQQINGSVFFDLDGLCDTPDGGFNPLEGWLVTAMSIDQTFSTLTNAGGYFQLEVDSNTYELQTYPPNAYWEACSPFESIDFASADTITQDLPVEKRIDCPVLETSISTPFLRRCFDNYYYVEVCNNGTQDATDAEVEVVLDPFMTYVSSSLTPASISGDTLLFDLGSLTLGACIDFTILINLSCTATLGQTHCTTAQAFPDSTCLPADPLWDESSTRVYATCESDSVRFFIENVGEGDMDGPREFLIVEDDVMMFNEAYELNSGQLLQRTVLANGSTWRLEAEQAEGHPGISMPSVTVEGCITAGFPFSTGFVTQFVQDDADRHRDIDCQENIGAYDPNDKQSDPKGVGSDQYIEANSELEYKIRFQNTGTDTAFTVVVRDTLPDELDVTTLVMGASSHNYRYDIREGKILIVTYENIMLPDSNVNEPASNGFFKFKIQQQSDLPIGTIINNRAGIYFDFNAPVITNTTFLEIGEDFLITRIENPVTEIEGLEVRIMPNPFHGQTRIEVMSSQYTDLEFWVYDALGQRVDFQRFTGNQLNYQQNHLPKGLYVYEIRSTGQRLQSGKLMVQ